MQRQGRRVADNVSVVASWRATIVLLQIVELHVHLEFLGVLGGSVALTLFVCGPGLLHLCVELRFPLFLHRGARKQWSIFPYSCTLMGGVGSNCASHASMTKSATCTLDPSHAVN